MSQTARVVNLSEALDRKDTLKPIPVERPAEGSAGNSYAPLIQLLCEAQRDRNRGIVVAFTAISQNDGVGRVVESLAWELASETEEEILLTSGAGLTHLATAGLREADGESEERVYRLEDPGKRPSPRGRGDGLQQSRLRFGFVLVDCPPLCPPLQPAPLPGLLKMADYIVLVAAAGKTTYPEVTWAQSAISGMSDKLLGWVLNGTPVSEPGWTAYPEVAKAQQAISAFSDRCLAWVVQRMPGFIK